jgi:hypothetical protein
LATKTKKPGKPYIIPRRSPKRLKQELEYNIKRKSFIEAKKASDPQGRLYCYFCGKRIYEEPSLHHLIGRDDEDLLLENYWVLGHNKCHVFQYHSMSWEKIPWWEDYLFRLKRDYPDLYYKELEKMEK